MAATPDGSRNAPFTTVQEYNTAIENQEKWDGKDVYLKIDGKTFNAGEFNLLNVQSRVNPPKLHLTLTNCEFNGNTSGDTSNTAFMYLPNCQELVIRNCTFDTGSTTLTYGINWNPVSYTHLTLPTKLGV